MSRVILQPASNKDAQQHFKDTIAKPVPLSLLKAYLTPEEVNVLADIYPDGNCPTWGVTPGTNSQNQVKWQKIAVGDTTLFSAGGKIFASGVTTFKVHNYALAARLWQYDPKGQTWEYIYFLGDISYRDISYSAFNKAVGYAPNFVIQGFSLLDEPKSRQLSAAFDLASQTYLPEVSTPEFNDVTNSLDDLAATDAVIQGKRRLEQARFRAALFGRKTVGVCGICGQPYPVSFLVTAHIKKRSHCTDQEKRDMQVVMPMCKFGCDELFEQGYIGVEDGHIVSLNKQPNTPALLKFMQEILGRSCDYFTLGRVGYFAWHVSNHKPAL